MRNNASTQNSHLDKKNTKKIQENNGTRVNCVKALYRLWQRVTMEVLLLRDVTHLLLKRSVLMKMSWLQQRTCEACPQCHTVYGITSSFNQNQFTGGQETIAAGINPVFRELMVVVAYIWWNVWKRQKIMEHCIHHYDIQQKTFIDLFEVHSVVCIKLYISNFDSVDCNSYIYVLFLGCTHFSVLYFNIIITRK